ncbi:hypothetical protein K505DRAFT_323028 [Melanomma pulvis-pyrius CBS 109.77]|uniref:Mus7/MMS22 family-domain-containing protein n=1 Tax=Melanomma pulvis-pyrius CBS 109.77 TaxID=1314802 RepID=A0A6A6XK66_9PLEO|nr:hypothetical protein K505DRAFT_323028 [Melanomma pulvis-pyrius CBS 109.77]
MSKWRLRGYVQDSDEEEEDVETLSTNSSGRAKERVAPAPPNSLLCHDVEQPRPVLDEALNNTEDARNTSAEPAYEGIDHSVRQTTPSIASSTKYQRSRTESPDPLQFMPASKASISRDLLATSQVLGESKSFNFELLSDSSLSDEELSEVPSIDEQPIVFASPTRQVEVQVVVQQSTAIEREYTTHRASRALRTRKPIQLHPYLLEGERYRREFQSRGIKPVAKLRSPPRKPCHDDTETQEQEFDPEDNRLSNSPPDISVSTPIVRRYRNDGSHGDSANQLASSSSRRNLPTSQPSKLHLPPSTKRRKFNRPSTQAPTSLGRAARHHDGSMDIFADVGISSVGDLWAIPRSPPYSSSPLIDGQSPALRGTSRPSVAAPLPNLPTPSNSSSVRGELQLLANSDSELDIEATHQPKKQTTRPILIPSDRSSSGSASSDSESVQSETEVQRAGKKIKGVLPASWLRLDRQAQERKKALVKVRERMDTAVSPEKTGPQRGVAQRIINRTRSPRANLSTSIRSKDLIVVSDESDNERHTSVYGNKSDVRETAQIASDIAATLDRRYADDSDNMEDDPLHLFTLGRPSRKRKRQLKLTDSFDMSKKRVRSSGDGLQVARYTKGGRATGPGKHKHARSRRATNILPALGILDADQSPSDRNRVIPQFIRLAKRQARQVPNHGRQNAKDKYIRLHTAQDTEDATFPLEQWRNGVLKPNVSLGQPKTQIDARPPLVDRTHNQQRALLPPATEKHIVEEQDTPSRSKVQPPNVPKRQNLPPGFSVFRRVHDAPTRVVKPSAQSSTLKAKHLKPVHRKSPSFRAAQLEGLETEFGRNHRKIAFEKGLQRVDHQFSLEHLQPSRNPQLARFLADDGSTLPPLPSAEDIGEQPTNSTVKKSSLPKRRLIRKIRAQRIDVDAREYRQPSEPNLQDLFQDFNIEEPPEQEQLVLQGLGPYGTRYPTNLDVSPLAVGTYFHSSTFIGGDELSHALHTTREGKRCLETFAGHYHIHHNSTTIHCGPWNDETYSQIVDIFNRLWIPLDNQTLSNNDIQTTIVAPLHDLSKILRSLINYFATHLSFFDPIDRREFTWKWKHQLESLFAKILRVHLNSQKTTTSQDDHQTVRTMTYLLVLSMQVCHIAQNPVVEAATRIELTSIMTKISKAIVPLLIRKGVSALGNFLEKNKRHRERENGIQDDEIIVESLVVCMHTLTIANTTSPTFWDLISHELSLRVEKATQLKTLESIWASVFTLLPFIELDTSGILVVNRRASFRDGNWTFIKDLLKRLFVLYPGTFKLHSSSLNEYVRASLARCHTLMHYWHWRRCDPMLNSVFDYFGSVGLKQLQREESKCSPRFLESLAERPALDLEQSDNSFHIFLKCVACGIGRMKDVYAEKKIRSIVLRITPNNGRSYPKDTPLDQESLDALRNHHDLFCTLYWASPPSCRPKLDIIRSLVDHANSHREACRLNVRAWANLTAFQLSSNEPYTSLQPFALWYKDIMHQTLKQYKLAKTEAEDYFRAVRLDGTSDISVHMVRTTIDKNQEQVIATLRDCIAGMQRAIMYSPGPALVRNFLIDSSIVELLELPQVDDRRLIVVIRETLAVLREYATLQKRLSITDDSQPTSEESQDYGDFPDLDDLEGTDQHISGRSSEQSSSLDFIQTPLWHLLSNAFGAEHAPDDNLLMECVDTWVLIAGCEVSSGQRSWSHYIDSFSQVSWNQLRHTEQARKFGPYFMAALITYDATAYEEHRHEFLTALLLCLVDRESMLRFQHRLLNVIVQVDTSQPLLQNLPFFRDERTEIFDIDYDTLRSRRLALISSIFANMRADLHASIREDQARAIETKRGYAIMLKTLMEVMKSNYQQLRQGSSVTGAYVEFVQKIVQFLKQYTPDILPVLPFFTDSVGFPLPAADPKYVVGRLCGYAPKLTTPGVAKQLSTFMQTVAQQAACDNQRMYLVSQLSAALCNNAAPSAESATLRNVLLQGIFPAYIKAAFSSTIGMVIASPILQALKLILETMFFDFDVTDESSVQSILDSISSISHAFIRSTNPLKDSPELLKRPHILHALTLTLESMTAILPILDYIHIRTSTSVAKPAVVTYFEQLSIFIAEIMHDMIPHLIPISPYLSSCPVPNSELLAFSTKDLAVSMKTNWSESQDSIFFGQGHARREVILDLGTMEEERARVVIAIEGFFEAVAYVHDDDGREIRVGGNVFV